MTTSEVVGPSAQTAAMTTLTAQVAPAALTVPCPICDALPGQPCEDAVRGWIRTVGPHLARIAASVDPENVGRPRRGATMSTHEALRTIVERPR